ncbi:formimidoylglutamase [Halobacteriales archaeon QS_1_68_20]|nr:MAG: formimidoylglutamase [Halobacteriales archaeon QS_1_68_20]
MTFRQTYGWSGPSGDPNDEQFGDVVERTSADAVGEYDAVLVGEPYDGAVIGRKGARRGPAALRAALAGTKTHHFDAGPVGRVGDLGDVAWLANRMPGDATAGVAGVQRRVRGATAQVHEAAGDGPLPVFLGGDNSLTYPNAAPLLDRGLGVINLDAHLDVRAVRDGPTSGTPYRQLFEDGLDAYACLGARHFETSTAFHDFVRERGGEVVTSEEVGEDAVGAADRALDAMDGVEAVYVSVDLDVLDAAAAPGVSAPTPGGLTTRELYRVLRLLASDDRVAGFEVVECAPRLDDGDRTARAGARAVAHFLAGYGGGR